MWRGTTLIQIYKAYHIHVEGYATLRLQSYTVYHGHVEGYAGKGCQDDDLRDGIPFPISQHEYSVEVNKVRWP